MKVGILFSLTRFSSFLGENLMNFVLPVILYQRDGQIHESGFFFFVTWTARILAYPWTGFLSGQLKPQLSLLRILSTRAIVLAIWGAFMTWHGTLSLIPLLVIAAIDGFLSGLTNVSFEAAVPETFSEQALPTIQAWVQGADQLAFLLGPILGVYLLSVLTQSQALLPVAGLAILGVLILLSVFYSHSLSNSPSITPARKISKKTVFSRLNSVWRNTLLGLKVIRQSRALRYVIFLTLLDNFLLGLYVSATVPLALGVYEISEKALGTTMTLAGGIALLAVFPLRHALAATSLRVLWIFSYAMAYIGFILLSFHSNFIVFALAIACVESSCAIGIYSLRLIRLRLIPRQHLGKTLGLMYLIQQSTLPLGSLVVSGMPNIHHLPSLFAWTTLLIGAISALLIRKVIRELSVLSEPKSRQAIQN